MKHLLTFLMLTYSYMLCGAQATSLTVDNQAPGWLSSKIGYGDQQTVQNLKITGFLNPDDLKFIGMLVSVHSLNGVIDLEDCQIVDGKGVLTNSLGVNSFSISKSNLSVRKIVMPIKLVSSNECLYSGLLVDTLVVGGANMPVMRQRSFQGTSDDSNHNINHIIIRDGVTTIGEYFCTNVRGYLNKKLNSVSLPETVKVISKYAFKGCSNLTNINLPDSIEEIQDFAFQKSSFPSDTLKLPQALKVYNTKAFSAVKDGQVIILGSNVSRFENYSDAVNPTGIKNYTKATFIINREVPPIFQTIYTGFGTDLSGCTIYVPKEGYALYKDPKYDSVGGNTWSGYINPYSRATIKTIPVYIKEIKLNHSSEILNVGNVLYIEAEILPDNADNKAIKWSSSDTNIANVDNYGKVTAVSSGKVLITATSYENPDIFATCEITVQQPLQTISLEPTDICLKVGESFENMILTYYPATADNKTVLWSSSNESVARVDANGIVTAVGGGEAKITVTSAENSEIKDECVITVIEPITGIILNKSAIELTENESEQLVAIISPENATNKSVTWASSDVSIAMVSSDGTVYGIKPGQATIMATTVDGGFVALCKVTVKAKTVVADAIQLSPNSVTIVKGENLQLNVVLTPDNVSNKTVNWTSTNTGVATVDASGLVRAISDGKTQIIATTTDGSNLSAICEVTVENQFISVTKIEINPTSERIAKGKSVMLNAVITPEDASLKTVSWSSTNPGVATVSQNGEVTAVSEGNAIVIASTQDGSNLSAMCQITVYDESGVETILSDKNSYVKVFNLSGCLVYEGIYNDAKLIPGFYIVMCDGKSYKIKIG